MVSMMRKYIILLFASMALMGSLVAVFAIQADRDFMLRGYVDATQTHHLPFRVPLLGVNAELLQYTPEDLRYHLQLMQEANVYWIRQLVRWDMLEPAQGAYDWSQWDLLMEALRDFPQLQLIAVFVDSPEWSRKTSTDPTAQRTAPPDNLEGFATFIEAFVRRYGDAVHYYQIWDEPNILLGWGNTHPNSAHYVAMLQLAYRTIHANDPQAQVIVAGLAPTTETGANNINEFDFMRQLYAQGAKDFADAWAGMPFGFEHSPLDRTVNVNYLNFSRFIALREIMIDYGDDTKPLWAGAWGWNSLPDTWSGHPSIWRMVSQSEQIEYTLQSLERANREWTWLGGMILYHWQPDAPPDDPRWGFAVISMDNTPSALYEALKNRTVENVAIDGLYPVQNPYTRYSGAWTFTEIGADIGWVQDSALEFDFQGRDVALFTRQDDVIAYFYITINNTPANSLPKDMAGNSYLTLRSADLTPTIQINRVATGLNNTQHTLRLMADELIPDELEQRYPLIGFAVSSGNLHEPYERQIAFGWSGVIISLSALLVTIRTINLLWLIRLWQSLWKQLSDVSQLIIGAGASVALLLAMLMTWNLGIPAIFKRESVQLGLSILTAGVIYLNPALILTIIAVMILFVLIYHRLELGILLTIFWSPFFLFPVELYRFAFPLAEVILLITVVAGALRGLAFMAQDNQQLPIALRRWDWHKHIRPLDVLMLIWLGLGIYGTWVATYRSPAITELRTLFVEPFLFYVLIRTMSHNKQMLLRAVDTLLLAGIAVSIIGLFMWLRGEAIITAEDGVRRLASVYGSPNNVGLILGRCIPFAVVFSLMRIDKSRQIFGVIALGVMSVALILTQSAGALFIGVPVGIMMVLALIFREKAILPLIGIVVLVIIGGLVASQSPRFERLVDMTSGTNFYRLRAWQSAINILEAYPVSGIGLDQYLYYFRDGYMLPDAWQEPNLSHPHNIIFDFWLRLGIFGVLWLIAFVMIWSRSVWQVYRRYNKVDDKILLALIIGIIGSIANMLAHGLVDNSLFVVDLAIVFTLLVALTATFTSPTASSLPTS